MIPGYLKKEWRESRWKRIARFRLGNEIREGRYWEEERKRVCRICEGEIETREHVWESCGEWKRERLARSSEMGARGGGREIELDERFREMETGKRRE